MRVKVLLVALLGMGSLVSNAQMKKGIEYSGFFDSYYWRGPVSITGGLGVAGYSGDLCSDLSCITPSLVTNIGIGYKIWPRVFLGAELDVFGLNATDKDPARNISFTSRNIGLSAYTDFYLREDIVRRHQDLVNGFKLFRPYVHAGITALNYNVEATVSEEDFPRTTLLFPIGLGANFHLTHRVNVQIEGLYHVSFTDYLDGVSENGNPDRNDAFATLRAKVIYTPFARRMKPKKIKVNSEQRRQWNDRMNGGGSDSTRAAPQKDVSKPIGKTNKYANGTPDEEEQKSQKDENDWGDDFDTAPKQDDSDPSGDFEFDTQPTDDTTTPAGGSDNDWGGDW